MTKISPPRNLTPGLCKSIEAEMVKACNEIAAKHGLVAEALGIQAMELRWNFAFGVRVSIPLPDGSTLDPEKVRFQALAEAFGLSPDDFGREFSAGGERFCISGIDPRRPKYPISVTRIPDGKGYKFTAENVVLLLHAAMKDVSPKGGR